MIMSIKEEIHGLTDEILTNLERLVAIDSQLGTPSEGKPFGEGPAKVLEEALKIADELGFKRHVMNQSAKKIMISDASKVNNKADIAPYAFCKFNEFDEFITNHLTPEQYDVVKTVKKVTQV